MSRRSALATVFYSQVALTYLDDLINILFYKNYFGFEEFAHLYVDELMDEVKESIHIKQRYKASVYFSRYGKGLYYVAYPKNKRTTWYFFFTYHPEGDIYFIRYITNNHVAGHLIGE